MRNSNGVNVHSNLRIGPTGQDRWRPRPSNPPYAPARARRLDERGYKADGTSRDQSPLPSDSAVTIGIQHKERRARLDTASALYKPTLAPSSGAAARAPPGGAPVPMT